MVTVLDGHLPCKATLWSQSFMHFHRFDVYFTLILKHHLSFTAICHWKFSDRSKQALLYKVILRSLENMSYYYSLRYVNTAMWSLLGYGANMTCMVSISDLQHESLGLCLVFSNFNIPLLLMFDKDILLVYNIIKHYSSCLYYFNIFCIVCIFVFVWFCFSFCLGLRMTKIVHCLTKIFYLSNV